MQGFINLHIDVVRCFTGVRKAYITVVKSGQHLWCLRASCEWRCILRNDLIIPYGIFEFISQSFRKIVQRMRTKYRTKGLRGKKKNYREWVRPIGGHKYFPQFGHGRGSWNWKRLCTLYYHCIHSKVVKRTNPSKNLAELIKGYILEVHWNRYRFRVDGIKVVVAGGASQYVLTIRGNPCYGSQLDIGRESGQVM